MEDCGALSPIIGFFGKAGAGTVCRSDYKVGHQQYVQVEPSSRCLTIKP